MRRLNITLMYRLGAITITAFMMLATTMLVAPRPVLGGTNCPINQTYNSNTGRCEASAYVPRVGPLPNVTATPNRVQIILTVVFGIIGALSVLMFIAGGIRYITSQGDPQQIGRAKGTLIYALVGLLVSISAVAIVGFVLNRV